LDGCLASSKKKSELFATISTAAWRREWVSFCKHHGCGNDALLNYLSDTLLQFGGEHAQRGYAWGKMHHHTLARARRAGFG
jgi:hypothetical protein